ncbi:disulfide bond formation protein B [Streptomyces bambusae]|uniref:disulfide bond formation protein B n=1 Tax=Streptomyces bambusae TaxID=1550616 RepID=UPI001CFCDE9A|nr:disulfide bond formation protein B [Streptomyces bambusae]MCB5167875.1 disulfide bond formation protein B [Streptomyces bambusae]
MAMNSILPDAAPIAGGVLGRVQYWFACFFAVGWTGVVCGGLYYQFVEWEYPCPLCIVQRMFMLLAAIGAGVIVRRGMDGTVSGRDYMMGWGLSLVAVMAGSFASWRQTMLHILPGDKGYGSEVFGLHLYVWAWILFSASVVAIGIVLAFAHSTADRALPPSYRLPGQLVLGFLGVVIAINVVAVFFEEGFHWFLPDDPTRYELLYDLGILD